ncbi:MAG: motility associated factor glycosyltransferase family protein, partial [Brevinematales bacterium]
MIRYPLLKHLAKENPAFVSAKDGLVTLRIQGRFVHSPYSPGQEALRLVEALRGLDPAKTFVIVLGAGLGYHIELLEKEGFEKGVVIETHPEISRIFRQIYDLPSSFYWIGPEQNEEALDSIFALLDFSSLRWVKTVILRGSYEMGHYEAFEKRIQRLTQVKLGDFSTRLKFEEIWLIHMIRNLRNLRFSTPLAKLFFRQQNIPLVIVSAGPSLRQSLAALSRVRSSVFMVAVDTALLPLYEAGIVPDMVYSLDAQVHTLEDFLGIDRDYLSRIHLVYDMVAHPETLSFVKGASPGPHYVATTAHVDIDPRGNPFLLKHEFIRWLELELNTPLGDVETGGSVSTSVFHASFLMGGNPLVLVGQDLAFSYQTTHVASTSHYYRYFPLAYRLHPINTIFFEAILSRRLQKQRGIREEEVDVDFVL